MAESRSRWYTASMKIFSIPETVRGFIFDIDHTLYTNEEYGRHQTDVLIEALARERGESAESTARLVHAYRAEFARKNGGRTPSLGNTFLALGVPIETSVRWRDDAIRPEKYLGRDEALLRALERFSREFPFVAVTNNPTGVGRRTLNAIGVMSFFRDVIGLDRSGVSKPSPRPFTLAAEVLRLDPSEIVSVGDRFEVDIEPALAIGMGGILVAGADDVVRTIEFFLTRSVSGSISNDSDVVEGSEQ